MTGRTKLTTAALFVGAGLMGLLGGDFARFYWDKSRQETRAEVPACNIYGEPPDGGEGGCKPIYTEYKGVEYLFGRDSKTDQKRFHVMIINKEKVVLDHERTINPTFVANYGLDDPQFNAMILALPPTNGRPICHFDDLPLPTHIEPSTSVYPVGPFQSYISTVDLDCDNRIETIRFWYRTQREHGGVSYNPLAVPRGGSDEAIFTAVEGEHIKWRQRMHVDEILAKVVSQQI